MSCLQNMRLNSFRFAAFGYLISKSETKFLGEILPERNQFGEKHLHILQVLSKYPGVR